MTVRPGVDAGTDAGSRPGPRFVLAHAGVALLASAGVIFQIVRPVAPPLGPPPDPSQWFDQAFLDLVAQYRAPVYAVGLAVMVLRVAVPLLLAFTAPGRHIVERIISRIGSHRPATAATGVVVSVLAVTELVVLPLAFWSGFVHDGRFGLRTQGVPGWFYDWAVMNGTALLAAAIVVFGGYSLARRLPRAWVPAAVAAGGVFTAAVVFASPLVLEPLLFRMAPLPDGAVRTEVEEVVQRSGLRFDRILVADASRRTSRRNAYVSGLWGSRRIVLYDTLIENHPPAEVGAVLAHELGHHRNADLGRGTLLAVAGIAAGAYVLQAVARRRVRRGRQESVADPRGAAVLLVVVVVLNTVSLPIHNHVSRRAEAAADLAALDLTGDPETFAAMNEGLTRSNLGSPQPPSWVYLLWSSHPMPVARLHMAERWPLLAAHAS